MGYKPLKKIQIASIDSELRNRLWNILKFVYLDNFQTAIPTPYEIISEDRKFIIEFWNDFLKQRVENYHYFKIINRIYGYFNTCEWFEVFDLIEFFAKNYHDRRKNLDFINRCNSQLEREVSAYRFVSSEITPITSEEEIIEIERALDTPLKPVNNHIKKALDLFSDRESPDYNNSVKESISAVESVCKIIIGDENATLGQCLNKIEKEGRIPLHGALKSAFSTLFGYASSKDGIRHGSIRESEVDFDIAKFMLVSCSAFINYIISISSKAGIAFS